MRTLSYFLVTLATLALGLASCSKDEDTDKPVIAAVTLEDEFVAAGSEIGIILNFTDNEGLKEYKIDIHDDFDGHNHGKTASTVKFETVVINAISGVSLNDTVQVAVPANTTAGPYHIGVYVLDAEGNQSDTKTLTVFISNTEMAAINISNLSSLSENSIANFDSLTLQGGITAGTSDIEEITITIAAHEEGYGKVAEDAWFERDIDFATPVASWSFTELGSIAIPATASGHYVLEVKVKDVNGNYAIKHYELNR